MRVRFRTQPQTISQPSFHFLNKESRFNDMPTEQASPKTLFVIVSVIGLIFAIVMVILFFNAAPARSNIEEHRGSEEAVECPEVPFKRR